MTDRRIEVVAEAQRDHRTWYSFGNGHAQCAACGDLGTDPGWKRHTQRVILAALDADWVAHLDELVEAGSSALHDALEHSECMGDTRAHTAVPVWGDRTIDPNDSDRWMDYGARSALSAAHRRWREG